MDYLLQRPEKIQWMVTEARRLGEKKKILKKFDFILF